MEAYKEKFPDFFAFLYKHGISINPYNKEVCLILLTDRQMEYEINMLDEAIQCKILQAHVVSPKKMKYSTRYAKVQKLALIIDDHLIHLYTTDEVVRPPNCFLCFIDLFYGLFQVFK